jgi:hypothetical protein
MTRATVEGVCTVEIEQTPKSFHAFSPPEIAVEPGDEVVIHDPPTSVAFGETVRQECRMTVRRASALKRIWTRQAGLFSLTKLYEVGFEAEHGS